MANEIQIKLEDLHIGLLKALAPTASGGIALITEDNFVIDFAPQDLDDEMFHVFLPNDVYIGYSQEEGVEAWIFQRALGRWKPDIRELTS